MVRRGPVGCQPLRSTCGRTLWTPNDRGAMEANEREAAEGALPPPGSAVARPPSREPGIAGLSAPYRVVAALAVAVTALAVCGHLGMVFLHVAPTNTVSKRHAEAIDDWIYPEFEQNWKLFAPNPLQQNIAVEARAEVRTRGGELVTGPWHDLSAEDGAAIRHSLLPSHTRQNQLRRAWDFYTGSHDDDNRANGERGELSEQYLKRIALDRLPEAGAGAGTAADGAGAGGTVVRIQVRSATRAVAAPRWSDEKTDTQTYYRELPWWRV
ncbi:DUF5819 family protein [Streptomyces sp. NPDC046866]|uniref:DUF5819 family protein n=1 Tax=Streptomyces sp. NPDC046866 TaxID=3154921 RepID=UPI003455DB7C